MEDMHTSLDDDDLVVNPNEREITLVSSDYHSFSIKSRVLKLSRMLHVAFEADGGQSHSVQINVSGNVLGLIVHYLQMCDGNPPPRILCPLQGTCMSDNTVISNVNWINLICPEGIPFHLASEEQKECLFSLLEASNYLGVDSLMELVAAKIACMHKLMSMDDCETVLQQHNPDALKDIRTQVSKRIKDLREKHKAKTSA